MSDLMKQALANCTPEDKRELLAELAGELFRASGEFDGTIRNAESKTIGYLFPDASGWHAFDPAHRAEVRRRVDNPGEELEIDEFLRRAKASAATSKQPRT